MKTEESQTPKKRGRPPMSGRPHANRTPLPRKNSVLVDLYVTFLKAHPPPPEPIGYSLELFVRRFAEETAVYPDPKTLAQKFAEAAGVPLNVAHRVLAGLTPLTGKMIAAVAKHLSLTTDDLLLGRVPSPKAATTDSGAEVEPADEGEAKLLKAYREANAVGKARLLFTVSLGQILQALSPAGRDRVIASLVTLHDEGAQEALSFLPHALGAYQLQTGNDPAQSFDAEQVFTPWHEAFGVFGPEQVPLVKYLDE